MWFKTLFSKFILLKIFINCYFVLDIMKCDICKETIEETFLEKIKGNYIKINKKIKTICNNCMSKYPIEEIRSKLS